MNVEKKLQKIYNTRSSTIIMHKLRNTEHIRLLEKYSTFEGRYKISKAKLRDLFQSRNWNEEEVVKLLKSGDWIYRYIND